MHEKTQFSIRDISETAIPTSLKFDRLEGIVILCSTAESEMFRSHTKNLPGGRFAPFNHFFPNNSRTLGHIATKFGQFMHLMRPRLTAKFESLSPINDKVICRGIKIPPKKLIPHFIRICA
jgi:hypothetical protein